MQRRLDLDLGQLIASVVILVIFVVIIFVLSGGFGGADDDPTETPTVTAISTLSPAHMTMTAAMQATDGTPTPPVVVLTPVEITPEVTEELTEAPEITATEDTTPDAVATETITPGPTETEDLSPVVTETLAPTETEDSQARVTTTVTATENITATPSLTHTPTATEENTPTDAPTATDTASPSPTKGQPTATLTHTPTATNTPGTVTNTPSPTFTQTPSVTPTRRATVPVPTKPPIPAPQLQPTGLAPPITPTLRGEIEDPFAQGNTLLVRQEATVFPFTILRMVLALDAPEEAITDAVLDFTVETLQARLALADIEPLAVEITNDNEIVLDLPETADAQEVSALLLRQAVLEFVDFSGIEDTFTYTGEVIQTDGAAQRLVQLTAESAEATAEATAESTPQLGLLPLPEPTGLLNPNTEAPFEVVLTGDIFENLSDIETDETSGTPIIVFTLTEEAAEIMQEHTSTHIGEGLGIVLDGEVISVPIIQGEISAEGVLFFPAEDQETMANLLVALRGGYLPYPLIFLEMIFLTIEEDA